METYSYIIEMLALLICFILNLVNRNNAINFIFFHLTNENAQASEYKCSF